MIDELSLKFERREENNKGLQECSKRAHNGFGVVVKTFGEFSDQENVRKLVNETVHGSAEREGAIRLVKYEHWTLLREKV